MTAVAVVRERALAIVRELGPGFAERAAAYDRAPAFPFENYAELRDAGMLGLCIPERYGGMGAGFEDYMHISAELARFCPTTALTYNMHSQTVLWTGILADDLDMPADVRARHERIRAGLYRWILEDGAIMSQPLSEGIARGATAGVATIATPGARRLRDQRPQDLRLARRRRRRLQLHMPRRGRGRACASSPSLRQPRRADRRRLGHARHARHGLAHAGVRERVRRRPTTSCCRPGLFDQLAARWPHVYLTLTPTYIGLTRAVVDFVQGYLGGTPPPGIPARRDVPAKQWAWAEIQIAYERSRSLWECAVAEAGLDPTPDQLRRAWAASYTAMETAPEVAALAIRACGGGSLMRNLPLEQHYRDARCGSVMLPWSAEVCLELLGRFGLYEGLEDHRKV